MRAGAASDPRISDNAWEASREAGQDRTGGGPQITRPSATMGPTTRARTEEPSFNESRIGPCP